MIRKRLLEAMQRDNLDLILVCSHENVAYCSGVGMPLPFGAVFDYGGGYPLGYVLADRAQQKTTLIISDQYRELAEQESFTDETVYFTHYDHFKRVDSVAGLTQALKQAIGPLQRGLRVGIEGKALPVMADAILKDHGLDVSDGTATLASAKQIKEPDELERIKKSVYIERYMRFCFNDHIIEPP